MHIYMHYLTIFFILLYVQNNIHEADSEHKEDLISHVDRIFCDVNTYMESSGLTVIEVILCYGLMCEAFLTKWKGFMYKQQFNGYILYVSCC